MSTRIHTHINRQKGQSTVATMAAIAIGLLGASSLAGLGAATAATMVEPRQADAHWSSQYSELPVLRSTAQAMAGNLSKVAKIAKLGDLLDEYNNIIKGLKAYDGEGGSRLTSIVAQANRVDDTILDVLFEEAERIVSAIRQAQAEQAEADPKLSLPQRGVNFAAVREQHQRAIESARRQAQISNQNVQIGGEFARWIRMHPRGTTTQPRLDYVLKEGVGRVLSASADNKERYVPRWKANLIHRLLYEVYHQPWSELPEGMMGMPVHFYLESDQSWVYRRGGAITPGMSIGLDGPEPMGALYAGLDRLQAILPSRRNYPRDDQSINIIAVPEGTELAKPATREQLVTLPIEFHSSRVTKPDAR